MGADRTCLRVWVEGRLKALVAATSRGAYEEAFDDFFPEKAKMWINGKESSREELKKVLWKEPAKERHGSVRFESVEGMEDGYFAEVSHSPFLFGSDKFG